MVCFIARYILYDFSQDFRPGVYAPRLPSKKLLMQFSVFCLIDSNIILILNILINKATSLPGRIKEIFGNKATSLIGGH